METAQGILSVVTANMARAIRVVSVQRGHDPRDYTLMAFGGAGPLHAARLARELGMARVLVPRNPGILCATGLLLTDLRADFATSRIELLAPGALPAVASGFARLGEQASDWFAQEKIPADRQRISRSVDMRYAGQNYELSVPLPDGPVAAATLEALAEGFAVAHRRMYGFAADGDPVQIIACRLEASGLVSRPGFAAQSEAGSDASVAIGDHRDVWLPEAGGFVRCPIYARDRLQAGNRIEGPAIVEQMDTTTVILPGMHAEVDAWHNLTLVAA
jgi:N-methylhydantoinase A